MKKKRVKQCIQLKNHLELWKIPAVIQNVKSQSNCFANILNSLTKVGGGSGEVITNFGNECSLPKKL